MDSPTDPAVTELDVVVVGAGFAGLYMLHRLRGLGLSARVLEAGDGIGGVWHWNRYPGARCDIESIDYSYGFSEELQKEWRWSERYPAQPEILRYLHFVADKFDLHGDIQLETRVDAAHFDEATGRWRVTTEAGELFLARYCVMATGCLSVPKTPDIPGLAAFEGPVYATATWPKEGVDFTGRRVAVVGTGSSGVQSIPVIAEQAEHLTVLQRTPGYVVPAHNGPIDHEREAWIDEHFKEFREQARLSGFGGSVEFSFAFALTDTPENRRKTFEERWAMGGLPFLGAYADLLLSKEANELACEFIREKIRSRVEDPQLAEKLCPDDHPMGSRRLCVDTGYFEAYNRDNVTLADIRENPIATVTAHGVTFEDGTSIEVDDLVLATGFDAMTGALLRIDIQGRDGKKLADAWSAGPRTYLGLAVAGFPNLFTITGPGSPSVLSNMVISIEQHVDWISDCISALDRDGVRTIEAAEAAQDEWVEHCNQMASITLFPTANSWYLGANVPGKPRVFMPYIGGVGLYREKCDAVAANGYEGFALQA